MSIYVAGNFIQKRGMGILLQFHEMLNEGKNLDEIASILHVSVARTNVLRDQMFVKRYHFKSHVQAFLQSQINISDFNNLEMKKRLVDGSKYKIINFDDQGRKIHLQ